jgi:hypothetical protein
VPCKKRDFDKAATKKGFIEDKKRDHIFYYFTDKDGKRYTPIHTKISHGGSGDISDELLSKMYKQMNLESKSDLQHYIDCSLSEDKYRE